MNYLEFKINLRDSHNQVVMTVSIFQYVRRKPSYLNIMLHRVT